MTPQACRDEDRHPTLWMRGRPAELKRPLAQGRGGPYLLSSSSWLDRSTFSFRTLSTSSRARCSFSSVSVTYWAPSKGQRGVSLLPGPGSRSGRAARGAEGRQEPGLPLQPPPLVGHSPWASRLREELNAGSGRGRPHPGGPSGPPVPSTRHCSACQPLNSKGLRPAVLGRPLSQHTREPGLSHAST